MTELQMRTNQEMMQSELANRAQIEEVVPGLKVLITGCFGEILDMARQENKKTYPYICM